MPQNTSKNSTITETKWKNHLLVVEYFNTSLITGMSSVEKKKDTENLNTNNMIG